MTGDADILFRGGRITATTKVAGNAGDSFMGMRRRRRWRIVGDRDGGPGDSGGEEPDGRRGSESVGPHAPPIDRRASDVEARVGIRDMCIGLCETRNAGAWSSARTHPPRIRIDDIG